MPNIDRGSGLTSGSTPGGEKQQTDALAKDLLAFAAKYLDFKPSAAQEQFVQELFMYLVDRDHKILQHGRALAAKTKPDLDNIADWVRRGLATPDLAYRCLQMIGDELAKGGKP
jgi:hypothetical protein